MNGPATFQRVMERVLDGLITSIGSPLCRVFFDDVAVASATSQDHLRMLETVFCRLRQAGLRLKLEKCTFMSSSASYLGVEVSGAGISTNPQKVAAIRDWYTLTVKISRVTISRFEGFGRLCCVADLLEYSYKCTYALFSFFRAVWCPAQGHSWLKIRIIWTN